jgi:dihydroneopterin aldolase
MIAKDSIFINDLKIITIIGVNSWKQNTAQVVLINAKTVGVKIARTR